MSVHERPRTKDGKFAAATRGDDAAPAAGANGKKKAAPRRWTAAKEAVFFRELGTVCNVTAALKAAGLGRDSRDAYERRKGDARFRSQWEAAIDQSYAMLEIEKLGRARFGEDRAPPANAAEARLRAMPDGLALQLLKLHQSRKAKAAADPVRREKPLLTGRALGEEIDRRLSELNRRMGGKG